jgi:hypothetical protein
VQRMVQADVGKVVTVSNATDRDVQHAAYTPRATHCCAPGVTRSQFECHNCSLAEHPPPPWPAVTEQCALQHVRARVLLRITSELAVGSRSQCMRHVCESCVVLYRRTWALVGPPGTQNACVLTSMDSCCRHSLALATGKLPVDRAHRGDHRYSHIFSCRYHVGVWKLPRHLSNAAVSTT